ncbi:uncharacterized protein ARMOST_11889 [Armillaria ostoyae]|uniref:Uncharacterized protein n=1 Tax=Armillaria ostoyae TaxID=47428 RepID=A0A284RID4_ARMOS|nr:uncharacterized protein ARMOST_11889 [Armillaria ostoyae]
MAAYGGSKETAGDALGMGGVVGPDFSLAKHPPTSPPLLSLSKPNVMHHPLSTQGIISMESTTTSPWTASIHLVPLKVTSVLIRAFISLPVNQPDKTRFDAFMTLSSITSPLASLRGFLFPSNTMMASAPICSSSERCYLPSTWVFLVVKINTTPSSKFPRHNDENEPSIIFSEEVRLLGESALPTSVSELNISLGVDNDGWRNYRATKSRSLGSTEAEW